MLKPHNILVAAILICSAACWSAPPGTGKRELLELPDTPLPDDIGATVFIKGGTFMMGAPDDAEQQLDEIGAVIANGFVPLVCSWDEALAYSTKAAEAGATLDVHVKIDTGMGRIGLWRGSCGYGMDWEREPAVHGEYPLHSSAEPCERGRPMRGRGRWICRQRRQCAAVRVRRQ